MIGGRRIAAFLLAVAALGIGGRMEAQSLTLAISALVADSTSPPPVITLTGFQNRPELGPYSLTLSISNESQFRNPFYTQNADGESATFTLDSLMTEHSTVYFRARMLDKFGTVVVEARAQHPVRSWLRLIAPIHGPTTLDTLESPQFIWSSPPIS